MRRTAAAPLRMSGHPQDVLAERGEHQVGRNPRHLIEGTSRHLGSMLYALAKATPPKVASAACQAASQARSLAISASAPRSPPSVRMRGLYARHATPAASGARAGLHPERSAWR